MCSISKVNHNIFPSFPVSFQACVTRSPAAANGPRTWFSDISVSKSTPLAVTSSYGQLASIKILLRHKQQLVAWTWVSFMTSCITCVHQWQKTLDAGTSQFLYQFIFRHVMHLSHVNIVNLHDLGQRSNKLHCTCTAIATIAGNMHNSD